MNEIAGKVPDRKWPDYMHSYRCEIFLYGLVMPVFSQEEKYVKIFLFELFIYIFVRNI